MRDEKSEVATGVYSSQKLNWKEEWRWGNIESKGVFICLRSERLEHVRVTVGRSQSYRGR